MNIFFNLFQKKWGHRKTGRHFVWGRRRTKLPRLPYSPSIHFKVRTNNKRVGPLVGIFTSDGNPDFSGNRKTFRRIHKAMQSHGGLAFVFTPQCMESKRVKGYVFNENDRNWILSFFPYPDVVYNRVPTRADESHPSVQSCIKRISSLKIPFFNGGFLDKWEMYECLLSDPKLSTFLPETWLLTQEGLQKALETWGTVYLKPRAGQQGEGIQIANLKENGNVSLKTYGKDIDFPSFAEMWETMKSVFGKSTYLIQPKILLNLHEGRPYDFRLIVQKKMEEWQLTGAGARLAGENAVTTHVPKGGELLPLAEIQPPADLTLLTRICIQAAERLEERFSPLEELSFDIGRDIDNGYWMFEANAKPMEFDEPEIETKRMERLIRLFYEKSGFE